MNLITVLLQLAASVCVVLPGTMLKKCLNLSTVGASTSKKGGQTGNKRSTADVM